MIREKVNNGPIVIDLTGPKGNAFYLLAMATQFAKQTGDDAQEVVAEMKAGDYENLVSVFDRYFGDFVILER